MKARGPYRDWICTSNGALAHYQQLGVFGSHRYGVIAVPYNCSTSGATHRVRLLAFQRQRGIVYQAIVGRFDQGTILK